MWLTGDEPVQVPANPNEWHAFYLKSSGGYLATNATGSTWNVRYVGGHDAGPPVDHWLEAYLEDPWKEGAQVEHPRC
jgi:hypothetical protein